MIGAIVAGLSAGAIHVLAGPDHLAAVAPLAAERDKRPWTAGLLWGLGHAGGVVVVGVAALLLREVLPLDRLSGWSERLVGLVLIAIGVAWCSSRSECGASGRPPDNASTFTSTSTTGTGTRTFTCTVRP
jgi:hydrogenase/urease accessory protein HupE